MESIETVSDLNKRLDKVVHDRRIKSARGSFVSWAPFLAMLIATIVFVYLLRLSMNNSSIVFFGTRISEEIFEEALAVLAGIMCGFVGFYFGNHTLQKNETSSETAIELDIYMDAVRAREEAVVLRNTLLKEQLELERKIAEQNRLISELEARNQAGKH